MSGRVSMIPDLEIHEAVADELLLGEKIIWSSRTEPELKENAMQDISVNLLNRLKIYIWVPVLAIIVWFFCQLIRVMSELF